MAWQLTAPQCFFIAIIAFGVFGIQRGWRRELVSLVFVATGILFLIFGSVGLTQFVLVNLPRATETLLTGATPSTPATTIASTDNRVALATGIAFIVFVGLGYLLSYRIAPKATTSADHIWGAIPGVVAGYAILTFVTAAYGHSSLFSVAVVPPTQSLISSYLLVIFIIMVVAVIVGLIATSARKRGGAAKK
jgi:hypothetical protein